MAKPQIEEWLKADKFVIADRYFYSNLAFQGAKIINHREKTHFRKWIRQLEFECHRIPEPTLTIFFDVPMDFVKENISKRNVNDHRSYLRGKIDIHEAALDLQEKVAQEYRLASDRERDFITVSRIRNHGVREALEVHREVLTILESRRILGAGKLK